MSSFDFALGETADMIRDTTARFAADRIAPIAAEIAGARHRPVSCSARWGYRAARQRWHCRPDESAMSTVPSGPRGHVGVASAVMPNAASRKTT